MIGRKANSNKRFARKMLSAVKPLNHISNPIDRRKLTGTKGKVLRQRYFRMHAGQATCFSVRKNVTANKMMYHLGNVYCLRLSVSWPQSGHGIVGASMDSVAFRS